MRTELQDERSPPAFVARREALSRRQFLARSSLAATLASGGIGAICALAAEQPRALDRKALIAITLDLEMARNFPKWEDTHWDYEKGNLNDETKRYAVEAARRVKSHGGVIHFFVVGRVFEQENIKWLKELVQAGHALGNHTYDHVYLLANKPEEIQYRFSRAPWLIEGQTIAQVLRENIRLTTAAMKSRLGINPAGFRTPGGFAEGLAGRADLQQMLLELGFAWVSGKYPAHPNTRPGEEPAPEIFEGILKAQAAAQPFIYPSGLIEVPMSPISDIGAFRNGRWSRANFLKAIRLAVEWTIERRAVFDFLCHPACLSAMDPEFRAIDLICELVAQAGDRAAIVSLEAFARRATLAK